VNIARAREAWRASWSWPLVGIALVVLLVRVIGIGWGLPSTDGWDNDGVAPRGFLSCLAHTISPGEYDAYPPVHAVLLGVVTCPFWLAALAHAPSLSRAAFTAEFLHAGYATPVAYAARAVSAIMSVGIVWCVAKSTEEVHGRRAGVFAAAVAATNVPFAYYGHTSNLDVPALFWGAFALLELTRAVARDEPKRLRRFAIFAALSIGTKDQSYALYLLAVPAVAVAWAADRRGRARAALLRELAIAVGISVALVALFDGVLVNPSGARARLAFLLGPASQPFAEYEPGALGRARALLDALVSAADGYPLVAASLVVAGVALHVTSTRGARARRLAGLVPLAAAASFVVAFECAARRTDARFAMPAAIVCASYAGFALDRLSSARSPAPARALGYAVAAIAFAIGAYDVACVDANLIQDPRYDAERWLSENLAEGDRVETYGLNVYLPRFPSRARVTRVAPSTGEGTHPLPGVEEMVGDYARVDARAPRWIVVSAEWARRFERAGSMGWGREEAAGRRETQADDEGVAYFAVLADDRHPVYALAHVAHWSSSVWRPIDLHGSTSREIRIYRRRDAS
jgi:4-amino-4-deoxy-L-arabinose transferase-like glycosyltransferase